MSETDLTNSPVMKRMMLNLRGTLAVYAVLHLQLCIAVAQGTGFSLLTITNPTPADFDFFGYSVAAVGTDRVVIGTSGFILSVGGAEEAYLFSTDGELLTTFTNPTPVVDGEFGGAVAAVGNDRVLIGAWGDNTGATKAGATYLFNANGALLTTFTNPTPATYDYFGHAVAAIGTDRVLIGAYGDDTGALDAGAAYLFGEDGTLLTTFTNPAPTGAYFGTALAAVGTDRVLISAHYNTTGAGVGGAAYLFSTNGALLTTFTNPTPATYDYFGYSVAAVGSDHILIGAYGDDTGASDAGAAYLFSTSGALLTTFTNPAPAESDFFGWSVAAMGIDRVLIGAFQDDAGASAAGAVYMFSTNGALLTTFTNPAPAESDFFGWSVAAIGADYVLIGAFQDDTGADGAGAVYLFRAEQTREPPTLTIHPTTTNALVVSWPSPSAGWMLQENTNDVSSLNWSNVTSGCFDDGTNKAFIVSPPTGNRFYRLFKP
jgi:hypothetical protein